MNDNIFKQIIEKKEKLKICANHPLSVWKEGYKRCYWGFKLQQSCQILEQDNEDDGNISGSKTIYMKLLKKGGE